MAQISAPSSDAPGISLAASAPRRSATGGWILNTWGDLLLFVATPVLIVPTAFVLQSSLFGLTVETMYVWVGAFGALGHHLPGMIRAYADRDLFRRFRARFIVAPIFLLAVCIPLAQNHLSGMLVVVLLWGFWHGLMQVYGFVRIYDAKVGSTSPVTAFWDWLLCLFGFGAGMIFSDGQMVQFLTTWYSAGGPVIPPEYIRTFRAVWGAATGAVLLGFLINYAWEWQRGPRPNPRKLLMLGSGIGFWWLAMVYVPNIILGLALWEIFHDIQYVAIVWFYNRRRVDTTPAIGSFMRFLFRRGPALVLVYVALVLAYGSIGLFGKDVQAERIKTALLGLTWASTILHFYYDGFIWKVREKSVRMGLGLNEASPEAPPRRMLSGEMVHALKWSPFVILLCWLSFAEFDYTSPPEPGTEKRVWPGEVQFQRCENITQVVPRDRLHQARFAAMLDNLGRTDEAKSRLTELLASAPTYARGHLLLGDVHLRLHELDPAVASYQKAIACGAEKDEQAPAHYRLGEAYHELGELEKAAFEYREAVRIRPDYTLAAAALDALDRERRSRIKN